MKKGKKTNYFNKVASIIMILSIIYVIFSGIVFGSELFYIVGAVGGCVFLIKLSLECGCPKLMEEEY